MYSCVSCGGALTFDILSQKLACVQCNNKYDPYEISKENDGEQDSYDVTVFKCPQCGGEIYSTDNTAAGFCSFCGASTILSSRLTREHNVNYIIPFQKTKEDCREAYYKLMRHAIFAPKELKNVKYIDSFRGIYMPYWIYHIKQEGDTNIHGTRSYRSGDYIITQHYNLNMELDTEYKGLSYDASSSFADNISEKLAPYNVNNIQAFTPSMLSGFYADVADIDAQAYEEDATNFASEETTKYIKKSQDMKGYQLEKSNNLKKCFPTALAHSDSAMFPVWFLSYRNKNRVAYATVNGQTGKVVADLPVDIRKYFIGSLILSIPIIILLNIFLTLRPSVLLTIVSVIAALVIGLHSKEMKQIAAKESYEDDKGAKIGFANKRKRKQEAARRALEDFDSGFEEFEQTPYVIKETAPTKKKNIDLYVTMGLIGFNFFFIIFLYCISFFGTICISIFILIISIIFSINSISCSKKTASKKIHFCPLFALAAVILETVIAIINPISDTIYYIGVMAALAAIFVTLIDLIKSYNILATRKLPQFDYKGGDNHA